MTAFTRPSGAQDHAFSSPSASSRTEKCPAAPLRESMTRRRDEFIINFIGYTKPGLKALLEPDNKAAEHGTFLHGQQEDALLHGVEMDAIEDDFEREQMERIVAELRQEMQVALDYGIEDKLFNDGVNSFGSADFWAIHGDMTTDQDDMEVESQWVHVRDLKTGYGEVTSEDNSQGKRYACGVMEKLGWPEDVHSVRITIDAFRFPSSSWDISREDLWKYWTETFRPAMLANNRLNPPATAGDHCKWCDARPHCAEFAEHISQPMPKEVFDNSFDELDTAELEKLYSIASLAKEAMDNLKAELIVRSEAVEFGGEPLTGYKVKQGNNATYVSDAVSLEQVVADIPEAYAVPKMKSPAALRALFKDQPEVLAKVNNYLIDRRNKPSLVKVK